MAKEKVLVVGLGEVGRPLFELLKESGKFNVYAVDTDEAKMRSAGQNSSKLPKALDVMHICIPCGDKEEFVDIVTGYEKQFKPELTIIDSTVPPRTTMSVRKRCHCLVAHSPVRGVHTSDEQMKRELKRYTKYVGGSTVEAAEAAKKHFQRLDLRTKVLKGCLETELAKLFETTYRCWMITCFQEMDRIARHYGADFDDTVDFIEDTHRERLDRPVMYPGVIAGHCLIPNIELLLQGFDSEFLRLILKSNSKRMEEVRDQSIREEVEKIRKRADHLQRELMSKLGQK
jgi:UDP-N-acetyl-D-mannosaminuronate dehydrogenase